MAATESSTLRRLIAAVRRAWDAIAPSPETIAQREALAVRRAYCGLLMEVARLESPQPRLKQTAVAAAVNEAFSIGEKEASALVEKAARYTSYYEPVALLNRKLAPPQRVQFVEHLWRVAYADGDVDMYEDQLVRKLSELLYVAHADFILAKHRVRNSGLLRPALP